MNHDGMSNAIVYDNAKLNEKLLLFYKEQKCHNINLTGGHRFPEVIYNHLFNGHFFDNNGPNGMDDETVFDISWTKETSMPTCLQETVTGIIHNHFIYLLGYCNENKSANKQKNSKFFRGFTKNCYAFDLSTKIWKKLPNFPGQGRQGARAVVVNDCLYVWGGWTFQHMSAAQINNIPQSQWPSKKGCQTFSDGYKLKCEIDPVGGAEIWSWEILPALPFPRTNFGICSYNNLIYICTGGHVLSGQMESSSEFNYMYRFDPNNFDLGWTQLNNMSPGTCRTNCSMACVNGVIYILGGIALNHSWKYSSTNVSRCYSILDQWKYDINSNTWIPIIDNVTLSGNWGGHDQIVYKNRYILMGGGAFFPEIQKNGQKILHLTKPCTHNMSDCPCGHTFLDYIYAFDTLTEKFIKCKRNLPGLINLPMIRVLNDQVMFTGGETYSFTWENEFFPRTHIDIFAIGKLDFSDF
jgi:hypothetical protein